MARPRNKRIVSSDKEYLKMLQEEYQVYGDWDTELNGDTLTIFALHRKYQRRKDNANKEKKAERQPRRERQD